jgi:hypothetical protein
VWLVCRCWRWVVMIQIGQGEAPFVLLGYFLDSLGMCLRLDRDNEIDKIKLLIIISHLTHALSHLLSCMNIIHLWLLIAAAYSFLSSFLIFWLAPPLFGLKVFDMLLSGAKDKVKVSIANLLPSKKLNRIDLRFLLLLNLKLELWVACAFHKWKATFHIGSRCIRVISWYTW